MSTIKKFEDLEIWQEARALAKDIYLLVNESQNAIDLSLKNQIIRSSGSIMDNIAEGFERSGNKEFKQFLSISKGSCGELRSQLYRLLDFSIISNDTFSAFEGRSLSLSRRISSFINYLNKSELKGSKFQRKPEIPSTSQAIQT